MEQSKEGVVLKEKFVQKCHNDIKSLAKCISDICHSTLQLVAADRYMTKGINETNNSQVIDKMFQIAGVSGIPMPPKSKDLKDRLLEEEKEEIATKK